MTTLSKIQKNQRRDSGLDLVDTLRGDWVQSASVNLPDSGNYRAVEWSPELEIFVTGNTTDGEIYSSSDGINWTLQHTFAVSTVDVEAVLWVPELSLFIVTGGRQVATSPDGITWTEPTMPADLRNWVDTAYSPSLGLLVTTCRTQFGNSAIMYSSDNGVTWSDTGITGVNTNSVFRSIEWSPTLNLFVMVGDITSGDEVMYSSDGKAWTASSVTITDDLVCVKWAARLGLFVAVGFDDALYSSDGITWSAVGVTGYGGGGGVDNLVWDNDLSVFVGIQGSFSSLQYSTDGKIWTRFSTNLFNSLDDIQGITYSHKLKRFCLVGNESGVSGYSYTSPPFATPAKLKWVETDLERDWAELSLDSANLSNPRKIAYSQELELYVAADDSSIDVTTSPDGITWTSRSSGAHTTHTWNCIAWSPELGLFVALSRDDAPDLSPPVIYSSDGITWSSAGVTGLDGSFDYNWQDITWSPELGLFAAVGAHSGGGLENRIMTSPDGTTWTLITQPDNNEYGHIVWSAELGIFVVGATNGTNAIVYSTDGINWSTATTPIIGNVRALAYSPKLKLFCSTQSLGTKLQISRDGINWEESSIDGVTNFYVMFWADKLDVFIAIDNSQVWYSSDGVVWTKLVSASALLAFSTDLGIWNPKTERIMVYYNSTLYLSPPLQHSSELDQINAFARNKAVRSWTAETAAAADPWYGVAWSPELSLFCSVSNSGTVMTSPDGETWTSRTAAQANVWTGICWSSDLNLFCAVAQSGEFKAMTSPDGITWTGRTLTGEFSGKTFWEVLWASELGLFVAICNSNTTAISTSPDGITWTDRTTTNEYWKSLAWSPELGLLVAMGNGAVSTSPDGITWTARTAPSSSGGGGVAWSPKLEIFATVGANGAPESWTSPDGINWTAVSQPALSAARFMEWSPELEMFAMVEANGEIQLSTDGVVWTARHIDITSSYGLAWSPELGIFCVTCVSGTNRVFLSTEFTP